MIQSLIPNKLSDHRAITSPINALFSTGPKDTSVVKLNAVKHGLTAKQIILPGEKTKKSSKSLQQLSKTI
ncbi:MAG: hypothetical protein ACUZ8O_07995 [Candidatus Anammoxibacter sp.]